MRFLLKCSEITAENNNRKFFKQVLNILCKVTGNGLRHTRLLDGDPQDLVDTAIDQFSKRLTLVIRAQGEYIEHRLN